MAKAGKRSTRFEIARSFFSSSSAGLMTDQQIEDNFSALGMVIYEKELPKFAEQYPAIDGSAFREWLVKFNVLSAPNEKKQPSGGGTRMDTQEYAEAHVVSPDNVATYFEGLEMVNAGIAIMKTVLKPEYVVSFALPVRIKKVKVDADPEESGSPTS